MKELFDVHCHMVPGVDDGAADLEESLAMLKMQHEDGVRKIIITPHYRRRMFETPAKKVHEQFLKLQEAAKKEYPDMSLYLGCELHSNMDLQDILEKRKYVTMAGSSYVLLEFSEGDSAQHIRERVYNVLSCGYEPIIAHVERYQATVKSVGFSSDLAAALAPYPLLNLTGCVVCGFSVGIMWPGTISISSSKIPLGGTALFALLAMAGDMGGSIGPFVIGFVTQNTGDDLKAGMLAGCIFPAVLILSVFLLRQRNAEQK